MPLRTAPVRDGSDGRGACGVSKKRRTFYFDKTVEVEIDMDDLEEAGYHHEDDCPAKRLAVPVPGCGELSDAIASLHRQAHPNAHPEVFMCPEEPCRSLDLDQIGYGRWSTTAIPIPVPVTQVSVKGGVL